MTDVPEAKKGTHPLVWVAVGCAAVIMLSAFVLIVGGLFFASILCAGIGGECGPDFV